MSLTDVLSMISQEDESLIGIVYISAESPSIDGIDERYLIVGKAGEEQTLRVKHYIHNGRSIEQRWISKEYLLRSMHSGSDRQVAQWILAGEVLHDPMDVIHSLRKELSDTKSLAHQKKLYIEFAGFFRSYLEAREHLKTGRHLSSFSCILDSLHHWARLAILEAGEHPETTIWEQIKHIDPSVYKLYEEFITSQEPLDKRIELLLLASEFAVLSQMENCLQIIIDILKSNSKPWTINEILDHLHIADRSVDLYLLLAKMAKRSLIKEGTVARNGIQEKCYSISR